MGVWTGLSALPIVQRSAAVLANLVVRSEGGTAVLSCEYAAAVTVALFLTLWKELQLDPMFADTAVVDKSFLRVVFHHQVLSASVFTAVVFVPRPWPPAMCLHFLVLCTVPIVQLLPWLALALSFTCVAAWVVHTCSPWASIA